MVKSMRTGAVKCRLKSDRMTATAMTTSPFQTVRGATLTLHWQAASWHATELLVITSFAK